VTQTIALLVDAYRELNSRKLFWLSIIVSLLVVVAVGALGIDEVGVTVFGYQLKMGLINSNLIPPDLFYKLLFSNLGVKFWLSWIATILALVSTAGMIPDLVAGGNIDMMLSKPISRARLFLTRWATGLLFVGLQAFVFTLASFLVIGIRGGAWEPALFIAVPVLVVFYSYLFCVCALVGLITRSAIASLIVTLIFWVLLFCVQQAEIITNSGRVFSQLEVKGIERSMERMKAEDPTVDLEGKRAELAEAQADLETWSSFYWPFYGLATCLPKTGETTDWMQRTLVKHASLRDPPKDDGNEELFGSKYVKPREFAKAMQEDADSRKDALWVIGTSLGFEAVVLGICVWIFRRRDF